MKPLAIGCGTIVAIVVAIVAYVVLTTDLEPTEDELAACDAAVEAAGASGASREETGYAIQERNGRRAVRIPYADGANLTFVCSLMDGEVVDVTRQERLGPGGGSDELAI